MSEIQVDVHGRLGIVTGLAAAGESKQFLVVVEFQHDPLPGDISSIGVYIPARRYERDNFIETVITAVEAELAKDLKQQREKEDKELQGERFERYAKKVAKNLGIDSN